MFTQLGRVKRIELKEFDGVRPSGLIAISLEEEDELGWVQLTQGDQDLIVVSERGQALRFRERDVRPMGRNACGVRGIRLGEGQSLIALIIASDGTVLTVTENGFGKRTPVDDYPVHGRGGLGVISIQTSERNGDVVGAVPVQEHDEIMLITDGGTLVRTLVDDVSVMGRNTQGVKMISLSKEERLIGIARIEGLPEEISSEEKE